METVENKVASAPVACVAIGCGWGEMEIAHGAKLIRARNQWKIYPNPFRGYTNSEFGSHILFTSQAWATVAIEWICVLVRTLMIYRLAIIFTNGV